MPTATALKANRVRHPKATLVFGDVDDTHRTRHQATKALHRLCAAAGINSAGPHRLRHTAASHLAMRGVPLVEIRDILGHASIQQTEVYARLMPNRDGVAMSLLDGPAPQKLQSPGRK